MLRHGHIKYMGRVSFSNLMETVRMRVLENIVHILLLTFKTYDRRPLEEPLSVLSSPIHALQEYVILLNLEAL